VAAVSHVHVPQEPGWDGEEDSVAAEVNRVVELVLRHAEQRPGETLGVIAMGMKHADRVQAALDQALNLHADFDEFFDQEKQERFFVKNLERVQGDERDAIILTVGYGKDRAGKLPYRFGPLLLQGGERRLNVAVTRARSRLTLVSSFTHLEMDPSRSSARGVELLRLYLEYAASGGRRLGDVGASSVPLNDFEADIRSALTARGLHIAPQWGVGRYRIDLAVLHPERPGQFVLAIECDGASYHSAPTARDRDRLRQQHLEALGWRFHRIWSTEWFNQREHEIERAIAAYQAALAHLDRSAAFETRGTTGDSPQSMIVEPATSGQSPVVTAGRRAPRPMVPRRSSITEYSVRELTALVEWISSDGRLRSDDEIVAEMVNELGFRRRGARIEGAIRMAIERARTVSA
jgi:very-short-patch-repair endonuclease